MLTLPNGHLPLVWKLDGRSAAESRLAVGVLTSQPSEESSPNNNQTLCISEARPCKERGIGSQWEISLQTGISTDLPSACLPTPNPRLPTCSAPRLLPLLVLSNLFA